MQARGVISSIFIILFLTKLVALDARMITKIVASDKIVLTKPLCKKKANVSTLQNDDTELAAKVIHLLAIDDFCNNLTEIDLFNWEENEVIVFSQFTRLFFTNLSSRYLTSLYPPPQS